MSLSFKEAWNAQPDGRSREQLYKSIVDGVKQRAGGQLSDVEAHIAARYLIDFCRELAGLKREEMIENIDSMIQAAMNDGEQ